MEGASLDTREPTVLVGLVRRGVPRHVVEEHLEELERLVDTAGGTVVATVLQERDAPDAATLVGKGFALALADLAAENHSATVVFDEDLTGSQVRGLERILPEDVKVLDRAGVILDIFSQRARTREAQTQVELAQLSYLLPRLTRRWQHLSRQAGGIGTRGVGETQLEIDRRLIGRRISQLKRKLARIERDRRQRRSRRLHPATVALVGYTNAGKSSLFRRLTRAEVLVEDRLFATLDPRARRAALGDGAVAVLIDTVGFIRKLPHHLVAPFRSTLEEAAEADLILHLVDASHPRWEEHLRVGEEVLDGLGVDRDRVMVGMNKIDLLEGPARPAPPPPREWVPLSAITGEGLDRLKATLRGRLLSAPEVMVLRIPLEQTLAVERALALPHRVARRFSDEHLDLAVRLAGRRLDEHDLDPFLVDKWESDDEQPPADDRRARVDGPPAE